jgi:DNA-binding beta-propeller fold protein YncE
VAAGSGVVWVANSLDQSLSRLTIGLSSADPPIALGFTPGALALDAEADALWIVDPANDAVVRFNTRSRDEEARVTVGSRPAAIAIGGGAVWVACSGDGTVWRIDATTNELVAIPIGGAPMGVAVSGETVWVAVAGR